MRDGGVDNMLLRWAVSWCFRASSFGRASFTRVVVSGAVVGGHQQQSDISRFFRCSQSSVSTK
jgi:hypothetical protein